MQPCRPEGQEPARPTVGRHQSLTGSLHKTLDQPLPPETRGTTNLQLKKWKSQRKKVRQNETAEIYVPDKRTTYNSRRISEVEIGNLAKKEFRVVIVMMIQDLRKRIEAKTERIQEALIKS